MSILFARQYLREDISIRSENIKICSVSLN